MDGYQCPTSPVLLQLPADDAELDLEMACLPDASSPMPSLTDGSGEPVAIAVSQEQGKLQAAFVPIAKTVTEGEPAQEPVPLDFFPPPPTPLKIVAPIPCKVQFRRTVDVDIAEKKTGL